MVEKREAFAPWSLTRKAGVQSATVNSDIEVPQNIQPTLSTGFVDEDGDWKGLKSSDEQFNNFGNDEAIANGATILAPQSVTGNPPWVLDMTGFRSIYIALKVTNGGNYGVTAVMGPNDFSFANIAPIAPARNLKGADPLDPSLENIFLDSAVDCQSDQWNIVLIKERLSNQKLLQFKITNSSGGESDIETAFMRLV